MAFQVSIIEAGDIHQADTYVMEISRESRLSSICLINSLSLGDVGLASWHVSVKTLNIYAT